MLVLIVGVFSINWNDSSYSGMVVLNWDDSSYSLMIVFILG